MVTLFRSVAEATNSLIGNDQLISKVYFSRLIIPTAAVVTAFINFITVVNTPEKKFQHANL